MKTKGFTLIELLIVVAIIGILVSVDAGLDTPEVNTTRKQGKSYFAM